MAQSDLRLTGGASLETKQPAEGAGRTSGRAGMDRSGDLILPKTCPLVKPKMVVFGKGRALPACVPPLRRASPPEGEHMSAVQLLLLEPPALRARLRHVRRPFTPSREVG